MSDSTTWDGWQWFADTYGSHGYLVDDGRYVLVVCYDDDVFHCNGGLGWCWKVYESDNCPRYELLVVDRAPYARSEQWFADEDAAKESLLLWAGQ